MLCGSVCLFRVNLLHLRLSAFIRGYSNDTTVEHRATLLPLGVVVRRRHTRISKGWRRRESLERFSFADR
jgi:hypothetical protein